MHVLQITKTGINILQRERLTSGAQGVFHVQFKFSPDWDALSPIATFTDGTQSISVPIEDDAADIPAKVLQKPGSVVHIGITGIDSTGNMILPTIVAKLGTGPVERGRLHGENESQPAPDLLGSVLAAARNAKTAAESAAKRAEEAEKESREAVAWALGSHFAISPQGHLIVTQEDDV